MGTVDPAVALRRIEKLEADRRRMKRSRARCTPGSDYARDLDRQLEELDEQIERWGALVTRAETAGEFKVWTRADFRPGDFVRYRGAWYEVVRPNSKSLTIRHLFANASRGLTWTARYTDGVTGRMSPGEMRDYLAGGGSGNRE